VEVKLHALTSSLDGSGQLPTALAQEEEKPSTHWTRYRIGRKAGLNVAVKRTIRAHVGNGTPVRKPIISKYWMRYYK
jgi:hypothetical protein